MLARGQRTPIRAWARLPALALLAALALCGCDKHPTKGAPGGTPDAAQPSPSAPKPAATREAPHERPPASSSEADEPPDAGDPASDSDSPYLMDELADVGPAGPATADARGVVMITRDGAVAVAKLEAGKLAHAGRHAIATPITPVAPNASAFVALARGPALDEARAYWVKDGKLRGAALRGDGKPEILATDARDGTRVASAPGGAPGEPRVVAYIAHGTEGPSARLWVEDNKTLDLSPEAAGANSVALARTGDGLVAVSLSGRTSMSPVHARTIGFSGDKPKLGKDVVVWVGGATEPLTELSAVGTPDGDVWAFLPLARDITRFGLARIHVGAEPTMKGAVTWRSYPNGLDPAPLATARVCSKAMVLYARPAESTPHSPQELHLAALDGDTLGAPVLIASAGAFSNVSVAALPHGAVVAYVADRRTWARTLRCRKKHSRH